MVTKTLWCKIESWLICEASFPEYSSEQVWKCNVIMLEGALLYEDSILYQLVSKRLLGSSPWRSKLKLYAVIEKSSMNLFCYKMSDTESCDPLVS